MSREVVTNVLIEAGYRCAVPTCRSILAIDLHHIIEVKDEGPNDQSNLLALCPTCHALYTRGTISKEAINAWKTMLIALSHAFDQESISNLLFLYKTGNESQKNLKELKSKNKATSVKGKDASYYSFDLHDIEPGAKLLLISGDGILKFSHLIASDLASYHLATTNGFKTLYSIYLTEKGLGLVRAWFSGNRAEVKQALNGLPNEGQ